MSTWFELSRDLKTGDRVMFTQDWDIFRKIIVHAGEHATVVENSLNEIEPILYVKPDNVELRYKLADWDGLIHVYKYSLDDWGDEAPIVIERVP